MQTEQKRTCTACGADNQAAAGFCWQCYAPFAPAAPQAQGRAMPPMPNVVTPVATGAPSTPSRGRLGLVVRIALGVVVAIIVSTVVQNMLAPHYRAPETLAGQPRMHNEMAQQFENDMAEQGQKYDVDFDSALYGTGDTPQMFLVLANGHAEESADDLFETFLSGIESAGVHVERDQAVTGQHGDAEYRCVPVVAKISAVACIWREDRSVGMTLDATPDGDMTAALFAAYDETHA